jgi:hypothetical protein
VRSFQGPQERDHCARGVGGILKSVLTTRPTATIKRVLNGLFTASQRSAAIAIEQVAGRDAQPSKPVFKDLVNMLVGPIGWVEGTLNPWLKEPSSASMLCLG